VQKGLGTRSIHQKRCANAIPTRSHPTTPLTVTLGTTLLQSRALFINWSRPSKVRMHCGMTRTQTNKHSNVRALSHKVNAVVVFKEYGRISQVYGSAYFRGCKKFLPQFHLVFPK